MPGAVTVGSLVINMSANTGTLKTDLADATNSVKTSSQNMVNAWAGVTAETDRVSGAGAKLIATLKEEIATFGMSSTQLSQYKANLSGVGTEAQALIARINSMKDAENSFKAATADANGALLAHGKEAAAASGHMDGFSFATTGAKRELLVLAHELSQGNFKRFGGSMLVLGEQTGAASLLFSAAGLAAIVMGAAILGVATLLVKGALEQKAFNEAVIMTGNVAGVTAGELLVMAHEAVAAGGSIGVAKEAILALAASGKFTADEIRKIGEAATAMHTATGAAIEDTIKQFEELAKSPAEATLKLNDQYHFLTEAIYEQILALDKQGDHVGAAKLAEDQYADSIKERAGEIEANLGNIARWWNGIKKATSDATDSVKDWGKAATAASEVARLSALLDQKGPRGSYVVQDDPHIGRGGAQIGNDRTIMLAQLATAEEKLKAIKEAGLETSKKQQAQAAAMHAVSILEQEDSRGKQKSALDLALAKNAENEAIIKASDALTGTHSAYVTDEAIEERRQRAIKLHTLAVREQASDYDKLSKTLGEQLSIQDLALNSDENLTAGQKTAAKVMANLRDGVIELSNAEKIKITRTLEQIIADEQAIEKKKEYQKIIDAIISQGASEVSSIDSAIKKQQEHNDAIGKTKAQIEVLKKAQEDAAVTQNEVERQAIENAIKLGILQGDDLKAYQARLPILNQLIAKGKDLAETQSIGAMLDAAQEMLKIDKESIKSGDDTNAARLAGAIGAETAAVAAHADAARKKVEIDYASAQAAIDAARDSANGATAAQEAAFAQAAAIHEKTLADINKSFIIDFKIAGLGDMSTQLGKMSKSASDMGDNLKKVSSALGGMASAFKNIQAAEKTGDISTRIGAYGDLAAASANFFDKESNAYKELHGISEVLHVAQMAMAVERMVAQIFGATAVSTAAVTSAGIQMAAGAAATAASVTESGITFAAAAPAAVAKAGAQTGWWGAAAMMAAMVALGYAGAGGFDSGSAGPNAADVQKTQNTGTVFGDLTAKSDSISKSMELLSKNSGEMMMMLPMTSQMVSALKNIEASIAGVANLVFRTNGVASGTIPGLQTGTLSKNSGDPIVGMLGFNDSSLTKNMPIIGALVNGLQSLWGKKTQNVTDSGFSASGTLGQFSQGQGFGQYADVTTTSSSWFGLVKKSTQQQIEGDLGPELSRQFGLLFTNLGTAIKASGAALGLNADAVLAAVNNFSINLPLSIKGLTGTALSDAINNWISTISDTAVQSIIPGMEAFQNVGEGYFQTVIRVGSGVETASSALEKFGIDAVKYTDILNKQGDVSAEIVRQSITTFETLKSGALTGVGQIIQTLDGATSDLASMYQSLVDVRKLMADTALNGQDLNSHTIQGAGGVSQLNTGLKDFLSKYFTPAEQSAAEMKDLTAQFAALGEVIPKDKEALRDMIQGIDTNTDSGSKLAGGLLVLTGAFSDAIDHANALSTATSENTIAQQHALDLQLLQAQGNTAAYNAASRADVLASLTGHLRDTQAAIYAAQDAATAQAAKQQLIATATSNLTSAYNAESTALQSTITKFKQFSTALHAFSDSLSTGALSTLSPEQKYAQDKTIFDQTASLAKTGDATALGNLQSVASQFLTDSKAYNASTEAYANDYQQVQEAISSAANAADNQVSIAQTQLTIMQAQVSSLITINTSVLSVKDAIGALMSAKDAAAGIGGGGASSSGGSLFSGSLFNGDGVMLDNGLLWDSINGFFPKGTYTDSAAASAMARSGMTSIDGSHANGLARVPKNGYIAETHIDEAILTAPQANAWRAGMAGGNNQETVAETKETNRQLRALVALQSAANQALLDKLAESNEKLSGIQKKAKLAAAA